MPYALFDQRSPLEGFVTASGISSWCILLRKGSTRSLHLLSIYDAVAVLATLSADSVILAALRVRPRLVLGSERRFR